MVLSTETLQDLIEEAAKKVRGRESELNDARFKLGEAERELRLLVELAELRNVELPSVASELQSSATQTTQRPSFSSQSPARGRTALLETVIEILAESGQPMQIQALMAAVEGRQIAIPGQGSQANLISVISRDPRIVRPKRGFYGLADWGLKDSKPARRGKRRSGRSGARK